MAQKLKGQKVEQEQLGQKVEQKQNKMEKKFKKKLGKLLGEAFIKEQLDTTINFYNWYFWMHYMDYLKMPGLDAKALVDQMYSKTWILEFKKPKELILVIKAYFALFGIIAEHVSWNKKCESIKLRSTHLTRHVWNELEYHCNSINSRKLGCRKKCILDGLKLLKVSTFYIYIHVIYINYIYKYIYT